MNLTSYFFMLSFFYLFYVFSFLNYLMFCFFFFFFFSSRRRHTRWNCDWSSDVCSSDLCCPGRAGRWRRGSPAASPSRRGRRPRSRRARSPRHRGGSGCRRRRSRRRPRSEERRVGKGVDLGGGRDMKKKKHRDEAGGTEL